MLGRGTKFGALIALAAIALAGCGGGDDANPTETALARSRARWQAQGIRSYRYRFQVNAFIGPPLTTPVEVVVRDGVPQSVTPLDPAVTIDPAFFARYDTIEELFAVIGDAEDRSAPQIDVEYDATNGVPKSVYIDYNRNVADEEFGYTVTEFAPL